MSFPYNEALIAGALSYRAYQDGISIQLASPAEETAAKMRPYLQTNAALMDRYDSEYIVSDHLRQALEAAPATIWLVITEGWCGDAA